MSKTPDTDINQSNVSTATLTDSRRLGSNMVWNLLGMGLPILVALVCIPSLIGLLGEARFGVLTITWLVFGYFSIFDMGLHRALTQLVSRALGESQPQRITSLFWTSLCLMIVAGLIGAVVVTFSSPLIVDSLKIPGDISEVLQQQIRQETLLAFLLMAVGLPVLTSTSGLRGMLESHQQFLSVALIQLWHGTWTFLGPLLIAWWFKPDLAWIVGGLLAGRLVTWIAYFLLAVKVAPQVWDKVGVDRRVIKPLLKFGGWMTLAHLVVPIILYGDRFIIATLLDTEAVAHYVTPAEIVLKFLIVPNAVLGVLFPAFAMTFDTRRERTTELFSQGVTVILLLLMPAVVMIVALAPDLLSLWMSIGLSNSQAVNFSLASAPVLQLLAVGVLVNGFALIPTALIQAGGKPGWVATLYCVELPIWYFSMVWLTQSYGVIGAASAWIFRQVVDLAVLLFLCRKLMPGQPLGVRRPLIFLTTVCLSVLPLIMISGTLERACLGLVLVALYSWVGWCYLLDDFQRRYVLNTLYTLKSRLRAACNT